MVDSPVIRATGWPSFAIWPANQAADLRVYRNTREVQTHVPILASLQ